MTYTPRPGSTGDQVLQHIRARGPTTGSVLAAELDKTETELANMLAWPISRGGIKRKVVGDEWVYDEGDGVEIEASQAGPASDGSQTPNGDGHRSSTAPARAGRDTPPKGANRDASAGQSHGADGSASPTGRGANGASARGAAPVFHTPPRDSQHVLKAEAARPDATDRETPASASPVGGPMGAGQPAAAGPTSERRGPLQVTAALLRDPSAPVEKPEAGMRIALWSDGTLEIRRSADADDVVLTRDETRVLVDYLDRVLLERTGEAA